MPKSDLDVCDLLFVYGTLRPDFGTPMARYLSANSQWLGSGNICARIYEINGYPGIVLDNGNFSGSEVVGDLFRVHKISVFNRLDDYEMCSPRYEEPKTYLRKIVPVNTGNEQTTLAWTYVYNLDISDKKRIPDGDYLNYHEARCLQ